MVHDTLPKLSRAAASDSPFQTCLFQSPFSLPKTSGAIRSWEHFPVSFRTGAFDENIHIVDDKTLSRFLEVEFSLKRLDEIEPKLWRVGYPRPPRSLNTQVQMGRRIVLTNAFDMHLVWGSGKIYLKPLPRYLLEPEFWATYLPLNSALGLLYTYACLISHPADLKLALEYSLIPKDADNEPDWATWRTLAAELLHPDIKRQVHRRFCRGELRLDRLNWIYVFRNPPSFELYYNPWNTYTDFLVANLSWVTATIIYVAVVLNALQVGLSTNALKDNQAFHNASYGFTVFAILGPIITTLPLILALLVVLVRNWKSARLASRQLEASFTTGASAETREPPAVLASC
ncbi:hypothetical protein F5Y10DRAFT_294413 [Nemania abortiva]|nr:hypothetical protein F5Y10DRAFT_294413 [Nemania abortiva]